MHALLLSQISRSERVSIGQGSAAEARTNQQTVTGVSAAAPNINTAAECAPLIRTNPTRLHHIDCTNFCDSPLTATRSSILLPTIFGVIRIGASSDESATLQEIGIQQHLIHLERQHKSAPLHHDPLNRHPRKRQQCHRCPTVRPLLPPLPIPN
jgi:hypothetical protein